MRAKACKVELAQTEAEIGAIPNGNAGAGGNDGGAGNASDVQGGDTRADRNWKLISGSKFA